MLWIEAVSMSLVLIVVVLVLVRHGLHLELAAIAVRGMTGSGPAARSRPQTFQFCRI